MKIVIDNEKNDDWMKALPGYQDEVEITKNATPKKVTIPIKVTPKVAPKSGQ